jgi:hypothetical protein
MAREWKEETDNAFTDACLLTLFVDVNCVWMEKENLCIGEFFFFWFMLLWF